MYAGKFNYLYSAEIICFAVAKLKPGERKLPNIIKILIPYPYQREEAKANVFLS